MEAPRKEVEQDHSSVGASLERRERDASHSAGLKTHRTGSGT